MNAGKPYAMRVSAVERSAEWGTIRGKIGAQIQTAPKVLVTPRGLPIKPLEEVIG